MNRLQKATLALLLLMPLAAPAQKGLYKKYFADATLRIDYTRFGCAESNTLWIDSWIDRQAPWHGSRTSLVDPFNNGEYRVEVRDIRTGIPVYSRCYSSLFREYRDTPEGKHTPKAFEETVLLPMPRRKVQIAFQQRDSAMQFRDALVVDFDPARQPLETRYCVGQRTDLEVHGNPDRKIDVAIVAQGYSSDTTASLMVDYYRMREILFGQEPFASHRNDFNIYGVRADVGADYGVFGADRYLMTFDLWHLHDVLGTTPCDYIIIMVNDERYGGGAIYNFYAVSSLHSMAEYVLPHEFGHAFGGLADEYVDEDLSYGDMHRASVEPFEPNITNLVDFGSKWQSMLAAGTPVPTPADPSVPRTQCGPLGVYEGAGYSSHGVYRPTMHCMMRDYAPFCPVCMRRLTQIFNRYTQ